MPAEVKAALDSAPAPIKNVVEVAKTVPRFWLKDDKGRPSITATIVMIAFIVTTGAFVLSVIPPVTVLGHVLAFKAFDVAACGAYLAPILALYGGRKWTDKHYDTKATGDTAAAAGEQG